MPRFAALLLLSCALSACGGEDGGAGGAPAPTPAPTPTPAPAPTPTPSPTPTPPPESFGFPLTMTRTFSTIRVSLPTQLSASGRPEIGTPVIWPLSDSEPVTVGPYVGDPIHFGSLSFANGCAQGPLGAGGVTTSASDYCSGSFHFIPDKSAYGYSYAWTRLVNAIRAVPSYDSGFMLNKATFTRLRYDGVDWERKAFVNYYVYGYPTTGVPDGGRSVYNVRLYGDSGMVDVKDGGPSFPIIGYGSVTIDFGGGPIVMELQLQDNRAPASGPVPFRTVVARGIANPGSNRLTGTFDSSDIVQSGTFEGALYGPSGTELALVFAINGAPTSTYSGRIIGVVMAKIRN